MSEGEDASAPVITPATLTTLEGVMGIKAVHGSVSSAGVCFGSRRTPDYPNAYFSLARRAAELAEKRSYLIAIGAGEGAPKEVRGRALTFVRVGTVYGPTPVLLGEAEGKRLAQWPVATLAYEVYRFAGSPHFVRDLGFPNMSFMSGLMDGIIRPQAMDQLWEALADWPLEFVRLPIASNIYDTGQPRLITRTPTKPPKLSAEEGARILKEQYEVERCPALGGQAKQLNHDKHGIYKCEACEFENGDRQLFDAHHPTPLSMGKRQTFPEDLEVLCPLCHRRAHRRGSKLMPFTLAELRQWVQAGRPTDLPG